MSHIYANRVYEKSTTTGTGTVSLDGPEPGYRSFVAAAGSGSSVPYVMTNGTDWEVGIGTITAGSPDTLSRDVVLTSSNSNTLVDWPAGTKEVFLSLPAEKTLNVDGKSGGQTIVGGTGASESLTLQSTSNTTRGTIVSDPLFVSANAAADNLVKLQAASGQTANIFETYLADGSTKAKINAGGDFTNSQGVPSSEAFGDGATVSVVDSVAVGKSASASDRSIAVGMSATASGGRAVAVGRSATADAADSIALGNSASVAGVANAIVIGSDTSPITSAYVGSGVTSATPSAVAINGTGGSGTDIAGADIKLAGGKGTGAGVGGDIVFQYSPAGSTGTSINALQDAARIRGDNGVLELDRAASFNTEDNNAPTGTTQTIDWSLGNHQKLDLSGATGDVTLTFTDTGTGPCALTLKVVQGTTARNVVWPSSVKWDDIAGTPDFSGDASKTRVVSLYYDGATYYAVTSETYT